MSRSKGSQFLRSNVLGLVAIFIAATGTAVVAEAQDATSSAVSNAKFKKLKKRVGALEATLNTSATGDLLGTYPNLQLAPNSVTANEIANNAVSTAKIADNAVTNPKVADDAINTAEIATNGVTTPDIATTAVVNAKIADDAVNAQKINAGAVGASELATINYRQTSTTSVASQDASGATAQSCNAGEQLIHWGGFWDTLTEDDLQVQSSLFFGAGVTSGANNTGVAHDFNNYAMCLNP